MKNILRKISHKMFIFRVRLNFRNPRVLRLIDARKKQHGRYKHLIDIMYKENSIHKYAKKRIKNDI